MFSRRVTMISQAPQYGNREEEKLANASDVAAAIIGSEAQADRGVWQRFVDALFEGRALSARREIARHQDMIAFLRRRLVERKEHLHLVPDQGGTAASHLGADAALARPFQVLGKRASVAFVAARRIVSEWRRRVRARNELKILSDSDLHDIGWTRAEVEAEGRKPFWRR
jgi:uncharacterized protein YjiS (DUF1127 family)